MELTLLIFVILLVALGIITDKNIFLLLDIIKYSLRILLVFLIFLFFISSFTTHEINLLFVELLVFNIAQIIIWFLIEKRWDRYKDREFYMKISHRQTFKDLIITVPSFAYLIFTLVVLTITIEFFRTNF